jgi:hypothetical protein
MSTPELDEFRRSLRRFVERELMPFERRAVSSAERDSIQRKAAAYLIPSSPSFSLSSSPSVPSTD